MVKPGEYLESKMVTAIKLWPLVAVVLAIVGGFVIHNVDTIIFRNAAWRLITNRPLYADPGASYFPPVWYVLAAPMLVTEAVGLPSYRLFPWLFSGISVSALVITALYGAQYLEREAGRLFVLVTLLNPLTIVGVVIWSQSGALVALGVVLAIVSFTAGRYRLFGLLVAWGAAVKVAPVFMLIPGLAIAWEHRQDILVGALSVAAVCLGTVVLHDALSLVFDTSHGIGLRTVSVWYTNPLAPLHAFTEGKVLSGWFVIEKNTLRTGAKILTVVGTLAGIAWSVASDAPAELRLLGPVIPAVALYPASFPYRWLPIALAAMWIGLRYRETVVGKASWVYGWIAATTGALISLIKMLDSSPDLNGTVVSTASVDYMLASIHPMKLKFVIWLLAMIHLLTMVILFTRPEFIIRIETKLNQAIARLGILTQRLSG